MNFGKAFETTKAGNMIDRPGWNGKGMYVIAVLKSEIGFLVDGKNEPIARDIGPFLMLRTVQGEFLPWLPSQSDLFAEDWQIIE